MSTDTTRPTGPLTSARNRAVGFAIGFTFLWLGLAIWRDGVTYHLAPILVASIPAFVYRATTDRRTWSKVISPVSWGAALAIVGSLGLAVVDRMNGPSLLPFGGALTESLLFAAAGTILAVLVARPSLDSTE